MKISIDLNLRTLCTDMITVQQQLMLHRCSEAYGGSHIAHEDPLRSELFHQLLALVPLLAGIVSPMQGPSQYASGIHQVLLHQYTVPNFIHHIHIYTSQVSKKFFLF